MKRVCLLLLAALFLAGCAKKIVTKTETVTHTDTVTRTTPQRVITQKSPPPPAKVVTVLTPPPVRPRAKPKSKGISNSFYACTTIRGQKVCDVYLPESNSAEHPGLGRYAACAPKTVQRAVPIAFDGSSTTDVIVWCAQ